MQRSLFIKYKYIVYYLVDSTTDTDLIKQKFKMNALKNEFN